jgi:hypothetical protein
MKEKKEHNIQISMYGEGRALDNAFVEVLIMNYAHKQVGQSMELYQGLDLYKGCLFGCVKLFKRE